MLLRKHTAIFELGSFNRKRWRRPVFKTKNQKMKARHIVLALAVPPPILGFWGLLGTHHGCLIAIGLGILIGLVSELEMRFHNDQLFLKFRSAGWALVGISTLALFWGAIGTATINYLRGAKDMFAMMPLGTNITFIIAVFGLFFFWKEAEDAPTYSD